MFPTRTFQAKLTATNTTQPAAISANFTPPRLPYKQEVPGSSPGPPTAGKPCNTVLRRYSRTAASVPAVAWIDKCCPMVPIQVEPSSASGGSVSASASEDEGVHPFPDVSLPLERSVVRVCEPWGLMTHLLVLVRERRVHLVQ